MWAARILGTPYKPLTTHSIPLVLQLLLQLLDTVLLLPLIGRLLVRVLAYSRWRPLLLLLLPPFPPWQLQLFLLLLMLRQKTMLWPATAAGNKHAGGSDRTLG